MNLFLKISNFYKYIVIFLMSKDVFRKEEAKGYFDFKKKISKYVCMCV